MADSTEQNKVVSLFQFIGELNKLKQKSILNYKDYSWYLELSKIPNNPDNVQIYYRDRVDEETFDSSEDRGDALLSVHKPEFQNCPEPDLIFKEWLNFGWDNFNETASVKESISFDKALISYVENFTDSKERVARYNIWLKLRDNWAENQKVIDATRKLFDKMYSVYFELQRESETKEIIVANGILCDRDNPEIKHPVLTHRVKLDYDADKNTIFILDTPAPSEIYSTALNTLENVNGINDFLEELQEKDYHPLDRNETPNFLKRLVRQLSSDSIFSESGVPADWQNNNRLLIYMEPLYIVRKRPDGTLKAIEQIIENVQDKNEIPAPISDIVSGGKIEITENVGEESIEEQLAAIGGESVEILLSKEANREQLEIARRIENYNAVLVQGPPGTGKTHTIANLMGHFLAQGKSVLVTSHTPKALRVLKEKVVPNLQSLCVSMIDDSNLDMERSIDGITDYMSNSDLIKLSREMDSLADERKNIIQKLAEVRRKIFQIIKQENNCIFEDMTPSEAAKFVADNAENLSYIPGKVRLRTPLPLTFAQLANLYRSNESLSAEDEIELANNLPSPEQIMQPDDFSATLENLRSVQNKIETIAIKNNWTINHSENLIHITGQFGNFSAEIPKVEVVQDLSDYVGNFEKIEQWMKIAAIDGKKGGTFRQRWLTLINQIQKVNEFAEMVMAEQFGLSVNFLDSNIDVHKATFEEMQKIFSDNEEIVWFKKFLNKKYGIELPAEDETESVNDLPFPEQVLQPSDFSLTLKNLRSVQNKIETIATKNNLKVFHNQNLIYVTGNFGYFSAEIPKVEVIQNLSDYVGNFEKIEQWMKVVAVDGKKGGTFRQRWLTLINQIQKVNEFAEMVMAEQFGLSIKFLDSDIGVHKATFEEMQEIFSADGKIGFFKKLFNRKYDMALESVTINDRKAQSARDCEIIIHCIELNEMRNRCAIYWDKLLSADLNKFYELDMNNPENVAKNYIAPIEKYLDWYRNYYSALLDKLNAAGIPADVIFEKNSTDSDIDETEKIISAIKNIIPAICDIFMATIEKEEYSVKINETKNLLSYGKCKNNQVCKAILAAINNRDDNEYSEAYSELMRMYEKYYNLADKYNLALSSFTIDGKQINSARDCEIIIHCIEQEEMRQKCAAYWDNLLAVNDVPKFFELDTGNQENIALKWIPHIQKYLNWYQDSYQPLLNKITAVNLPADVIFEKNSLDSDIDEFEKIFSAIKNNIPAICDIFMAAIDAEIYSAKINETKKRHNKYFKLRQAWQQSSL